MTWTANYMDLIMIMTGGGPDGILRVHLGMKGFRRRIRAG
jgi:hypothetical protein